MADPRLDTVEGCVAELTSCNREVAEFAHEWASDAGELKMLEKRYERLYRAAMRGTKGSNADERAATAHAAVEALDEERRGEDDPAIAERIEELVGRVEEHRRLFDTIERRSSNAQSIMRMRREEGRLDPFVPRDMQ